MNNKGQSTVIFIILIPIFVLVSSYIIDTAIGMYQNNKFKNTTEDIITSVYNNEEISIEEYDEEIKKLYEKNDYDTSMLIVEANEYRMYLENEHIYFSIYSSIFNRKSKAMIKVEVRKDNSDELVFEYVE